MRTEQGREVEQGKKSAKGNVGKYINNGYIIRNRITIIPEKARKIYLNLFISCKELMTFTVGITSKRSSD